MRIIEGHRYPPERPPAEVQDAEGVACSDMVWRGEPNAMQDEYDPEIAEADGDEEWERWISDDLMAEAIDCSDESDRYY